MNADQNPYASPVDLSSARWDHSLTKRIFYACLTIAIFYLMASAGATWKAFRSDWRHNHEPIVNTVTEFFSNWNDSNTLE